MDPIEIIVAEMLAKSLDTLDYYFEVYDELSEEREALHDHIVQTILSKKNYNKGKKIWMLGGAPANGKSSFLKSGLIRYPDSALKIDPDEIKSMLPEYNYMIENGEPLAAALVHEESSYLSKEIRSIAVEEGYDMILDGVANEILETRLKDIHELKSNGHTIRIDYVTLDTNLSLKLAELRFQANGRMVPETYILEKNQMLAELVPQLIDAKAFDELYLWDTNIENHPRLILSQINGKLAIENNVLFENFKKKADVEA